MVKACGQSGPRVPAAVLASLAVMVTFCVATPAQARSSALSHAQSAVGDNLASRQAVAHWVGRLQQAARQWLSEHQAESAQAYEPAAPDAALVPVWTINRCESFSGWVVESDHSIKLATPIQSCLIDLPPPAL